LLFASGGQLLLLEKSEVKDALSGQLVLRLSFNEGQVRNLSWATAAALSADRRTLAVSEGWGEGVLLFEMRTGRHRGTLPAEGRYQRGLRFLPDGRLVTAGDTALVWSVGLPRVAAAEAGKLEEPELSGAWAALAGASAEKAWSAMVKLARSPASAVPLLREQVRPVPRGTDADLERIFRGLDARRFKEREAAARELDALGAAAVGRVKKRLEQGASEEVTARLKQFLARHDRPERAEEVRTLRAVEVLEAIGTSEAKGLLEELAKGEASAPLTQEAIQALRRLPRR
jgi:hypothetical protein